MVIGFVAILAILIDLHRMTHTQRIGTKRRLSSPLENEQPITKRTCNASTSLRQRTQSMMNLLSKKSTSTSTSTPASADPKCQVLVVFDYANKFDLDDGGIPRPGTSSVAESGGTITYECMQREQFVDAFNALDQKQINAYHMMKIDDRVGANADVASPARQNGSTTDSMDSTDDNNNNFLTPERHAVEAMSFETLASNSTAKSGGSLLGTPLVLTPAFAQHRPMVSPGSAVSERLVRARNSPDSDKALDPKAGVNGNNRSGRPNSVKIIRAVDEIIVLMKRLRLMVPEEKKSTRMTATAGKSGAVTTPKPQQQSTVAGGRSQQSTAVPSGRSPKPPSILGPLQQQTISTGQPQKPIAVSQPKLQSAMVMGQTQQPTMTMGPPQQAPPASGVYFSYLSMPHYSEFLPMTNSVLCLTFVPAVSKRIKRIKPSTVSSARLRSHKR